MIEFYKVIDRPICYAVFSVTELTEEDLKGLARLFGAGSWANSIVGSWLGPKPCRITPWSSNAVDIAHSVGIATVTRIEEFHGYRHSMFVDKMLNHVYDGLGPQSFTDAAEIIPDCGVADINDFNNRYGLGLDDAELEILKCLSKREGRLLTSAEIYGIAQTSSDHCRHKTFRGNLCVEGKSTNRTLFSYIASTTEGAGGANIVSAFTDNSAVLDGGETEALTVKNGLYTHVQKRQNITLKAETHNFPTTVEPFNGAATGVGGEIRDRLCTGRGSLPLAGVAVYMASPEQSHIRQRQWIYNSPRQLLVRASDGASDFNNKYGQPLICGSVLTAEGIDLKGRLRAFDKCVMLAGGVGLVDADRSHKDESANSAVLLLLGGANYRIGLGGGTVSSAGANGVAKRDIELQAVQRANPEMQRRVANIVRTLTENATPGLFSIHDLGAGGNFNALFEIAANFGCGHIRLDDLPLGEDMSAAEILGNESQERIAIAVSEDCAAEVERLCQIENVPCARVGTAGGGHGRFIVEHKGKRVVDISIDDTAFKPRDINIDLSTSRVGPLPSPDIDIEEALEKVLGQEGVGCKDWLTNKADRSVTGLVATQQCVGAYQLPMADCGVVAIDYTGTSGIATALGMAPMAALSNPELSAQLSVLHALTNICGCNLTGGLQSVALSANWMWPANKPADHGELFKAVEALSDYVRQLGIAIPTGKDSLSMSQRYADGSEVAAPGTLIITAAAKVQDVRQTIGPVLKNRDSYILYVPFGVNTGVGGTALAQAYNLPAATTICTPFEAEIVKKNFEAVQELIKSQAAHAVHDVGRGGLIVTLLEMCFAEPDCPGMDIDLSALGEPVCALFGETPAAVIQTNDLSILSKAHGALVIGKTSKPGSINIKVGVWQKSFDLDKMRRSWFGISAKLDAMQTSDNCSAERVKNFCQQPVVWNFSDAYSEELNKPLDNNNLVTKPLAAIIRTCGSNGHRELANALCEAGFVVRDIHINEICSGHATLTDVRLVAFSGGFANSDVLGAGAGWAAQIQSNPRAAHEFKEFYCRPDTVSIGVCNGCQLMVRMGIFDTDECKVSMKPNLSGKFESAFVSLDLAPSEQAGPLFANIGGNTLGVWVAHAEGRFVFSGEPVRINGHIAARYHYSEYPGNPNGSDCDAAALISADGRHLAIMPHPERCIYPWQCAHYPEERIGDAYTPWIQLFSNARRWIVSQ